MPTRLVLPANAALLIATVVTPALMVVSAVMVHADAAHLAENVPARYTAGEAR